METLTWIGLALGAVGIVVGATALHRAVPTFTVGTPHRGTYEIWHTGPKEIVVRRALYEDFYGGQHPIDSNQSDIEVHDIDGAPFPLPSTHAPPDWKGAKMAPHKRYYVMMNNNSSFVLEYRATGLLGHISRASFRIDEGP